jgi:hypothetical protein
MAAWASGTTYTVLQAVTGSDGITYTSQGNGNIGHDPTLDAGSVFWTRFYNWNGQSCFSPGAHSPGSHFAGVFGPGVWH